MNAEVASVSTQLTVAQRAQVALQSAENEKKLAELAEASKTITDITNTAGYQQCHVSRMALKKMRVDIERIGKQARQDAQTFSKAVIAEESRLIGIIEPEETRLEKLQNEWDAARKREKEAREAAERQRVTTIRERIDEIRQRPADAIGQSAVEIELYVHALTTLEIDDSFAEFQQEAVGAKETALIRLRSTHAKAAAHEEQQRQLAEERERLASEREEQERLQAAERARIAEQERQARVAREEEEKRAREAREAEDRRLAEQRRRQEAELQTQRERLAEQERIAAATRKAEEDRLAAERRRQQAEADRLEIQRVEAQKADQARRDAIDAEERRIAADRAQLEQEREEQRMREAGGGVPAGTTASESGDSNIVNATTEPETESIASTTSEPEATWLQPADPSDPPPFAHRCIHEACEQIDAGFFSGDAFHSHNAIALMEWYMGRWQRQIASIREMLADEERGVS